MTQKSTIAHVSCGTQGSSRTQGPFVKTLPINFLGIPQKNSKREVETSLVDSTAAQPLLPTRGLQMSSRALEEGSPSKWLPNFH